MKKAIGIDIGGTNYRIGCMSEDGELLFVEKVSADVLRQGGPATELLEKSIRNAMRENSIDSIDAICIGFPSPVSAEGVVYHCPNVVNPAGGFDGVNISELYGKSFGVPVYVQKDANILLQCEITERNISKDAIVIGIYYGTGIGNSVYYRGEILRGSHGFMCDLGHIPVFKSDRVCNCGNVGCVECYGSGAYLVKLWREKFSDVPIDDLFEVYGDRPELMDFAEACALPAATEINIFDPDLTILGGGILNMKNFPYDFLLKKVYDFTRKPIPAQDLKFERAYDAKDTGVKGAAYYAFEKLRG